MKPVRICLFILFLAGIAFAQQKRLAVSAESIQTDMQMHVCKNDERLESVKKIFKKMGAAENEMQIEKFDDVENLVVTKKGKTDQTVIIGAHLIGCI